MRHCETGCRHIKRLLAGRGIVSFFPSSPVHTTIEYYRRTVKAAKAAVEKKEKKTEKDAFLPPGISTGTAQTFSFFSWKHLSNVSVSATGEIEQEKETWLLDDGRGEKREAPFFSFPLLFDLWVFMQNNPSTSVPLPSRGQWEQTQFSRCVLGETVVGEDENVNPPPPLSCVQLPMPAFRSQFSCEENKTPRHLSTHHPLPSSKRFTGAQSKKQWETIFEFALFFTC